MAITTAATTIMPRERTPDSAQSPRRSFRARLAIYLEALRDGVAMGRRYEALKGRGISHDQALTRALSETGYGG